MSEPVAIREGKPFDLDLSMANRHGLVAGATGTGKTVTLQRLAERFSAAGVPVFMADIKGDLSGLAAPGGGNARVDAALASFGLSSLEKRANPAVFWDVFGERGHPVRATVSEMGPLLLSRALGLSETQESVLQVVFRVADERDLPVLDLKDLRALLDFCTAHAKELEPAYGRMASTSLGAVQRSVVALEGQAGSAFFGEPALDIRDFMRKDPAGRGIVNVLAADRLVESPALYGAFLLWLLSELFEELPEKGDADKPEIVFFFDEAHLLFEDASQELVRSVVRTVRLIRSKGVGVWFVTQNPLDIPDEVRGQLGNRVQHALRAYSEAELKATKAIAQSFRPNPALDVASALPELATGEVILSFLDADGVPGIAERARIVPPLSRTAPLAEAERESAMAASGMGARYDHAVDRESAYEMLRGGAVSGRPAPTGAGEAPKPSAPPDMDAQMAALEAELRGETPLAAASEGMAEERPYSLDPLAEPSRRGSPRAATAGSRSGNDSMMESLAKSALRAAGTELGRQVIRGVLGGAVRGSRRRTRLF